MTKIMSTRHAEKPNGEPGAMPDGTENVEALHAQDGAVECSVGLFDQLHRLFASIFVVRSVLLARVR